MLDNTHLFLKARLASLHWYMRTMAKWRAKIDSGEGGGGGGGKKRVRNSEQGEGGRVQVTSYTTPSISMVQD